MLSANAASAAPAARDPRFGINQAWQAADQADVAGAGWSRVLFWWSELQKHGPSDFDLHATDHDSFLDAEIHRGRELAGAILNTPRWASMDGSPNGVPRGLYLPWDHPDNSWGQFTWRLADHYRGRIDTWIIWNEVDIQRGQWKTWNGTTADYVQLLKVAYIAIKDANPEARVLPFGAAYWYDHGATVSRMLDLIAADADSRRFNGYMDAVNLHLYSRANDIPRVVSWYREQLRSRGLDKPIWVGETNAVPYDDPAWQASKENFRASLDDQASYIVQAFATYLGLGVQRASVNRMIDGTDFEAGGEPFGMLRNDGTARPALTAFQVVTNYFHGATSGEFHPTEASGLTRAVLKKPGETVTVAWNMRPETADVTIPATAARALRVSKYGQATVVQAANGQYRFTLTPATANSNESDPRDFVIGGSPLILVERQDGNPQAAYRAVR